MTQKKIQALRDRIKAREQELAVTTDHSTDAHYYVRDDAKYPSVTQKLGLVKDQGLSNWRINRTFDWIFQHFNEITEENLMEMLEKAKNAPQLEFENAGNIGNQVHGWRELWFQNWLETDEVACPSVSEGASPAVISGTNAIRKFVQEHNYIPVACELDLADHDLKLGGALDDLGIVDGELALVDLKTSNIGDKNSYHYQVALYYMMLAKNYGIRPKKAYILHVSKVNGTYNLIEIKNMPQLMREAKLILKLHDALDRLTASKKKERVTYEPARTEEETAQGQRETTDETAVPSVQSIDVSG